MDCKLFSQPDCRELVCLPRHPHLYYNTHCTRNIVTQQLQHCFVNFFTIFLVQWYIFFTVLERAQCALRGPVLMLCRVSSPLTWGISIRVNRNPAGFAGSTKRTLEIFKTGEKKNIGDFRSFFTPRDVCTTTTRYFSIYAFRFA